MTNTQENLPYTLPLFLFHNFSDFIISALCLDTRKSILASVLLLSHLSTQYSLPLHLSVGICNTIFHALSPCTESFLFCASFSLGNSTISLYSHFFCCSEKSTASFPLQLPPLNPLMCNQKHTICKFGPKEIFALALKPPRRANELHESGISSF